MPTRNINLTLEREALRALQQRRREDGLKLEALRAQLKAGVDALDRGDFVELDDASLERYLTPGKVRRRTRTR